QSTAREVARARTSDTTEPTQPFAIRLALKDVHGISDAEVRSILEARADRSFADVGDFVRRTTVSKPVVERLAHAGAFDALPGGSAGTAGGRAGRGRSAAFRGDPRAPASSPAPA